MSPNDTDELADHRRAAERSLEHSREAVERMRDAVR
jgi:hypothetical protein